MLEKDKPPGGLNRGFTVKHIAIPMTSGRGKRLTWTLEFAAFMVNHIGAWFFDVGEICELRLHTVTCLASLYIAKTTLNKQRAAKPYKMAMN